MSLIIDRKFLSTHVTCLKFYKNYLLAGIGGNLNILQNSTWKIISTHLIFENQNIYGFKPKNDQILIYGGGKLALIKYTLEQERFEILKYFNVKEWIMDAVWLETEIAVLTANNSVLKLSLDDGKIIENNPCSIRCILYSGVLLNNNWKDIVVLAGTVFQEVIIWCNNQNLILHRLKGHKGVIFSVRYYPELNIICTTSDDRTVRFWDVSDQNWFESRITLKYTIFAHTARVWDSCFIKNGFIVSIGEDSLIAMWNKYGECENQWIGHGGCIWSVDSCEKLQVIATGGSDGGINIWPIASRSLPEILPFESNNGKRNPRCLVISKSKNIFVMTNLGEFIYFNGKTWNTLFQDDNFNNYCQLNISYCRNFISLGSLYGHIVIFDVVKMKKCIDLKAIEGRIFSLIWTSDFILSSCGINGEIIIWKFDPDNYLLDKIKIFNLPKSKERWFTCSCMYKDFFLCGDRGGSIYLFDITSQLKEPISILKKEHGIRGVNDIKNLNGSIISCGRDGTYKQLIIQNSQLIVMSTYKLQMEWAAAISKSALFGNIIIGFFEVQLIIWSINERRQILSIDCGGGHRSWDCFIQDDKTGEITVSFIKEKNINFFSKPVNSISLQNALAGYHTKTINSSSLIIDENKFYIVSGGEDTTLRLFKIEKDQLLTCGIFRTHISSIKTVSSLKNSKADVYISSGGGRGQLIVWKLDQDTLQELSKNMLRVENKPCEQNEPLDEPEIRYMDLSMIEYNSETLCIIGGCSDGIIRCHKFSISTNIINEYSHVKLDYCCILKIKLINDYITCGYTDGKIAFWDLKSLTNKTEDNYIISHNIHSLGINSLDIVQKDAYIIMASGSDDSSISINCFDIKNGLKLISTYTNKTLHTCQISGIKISGNYLISGGMDQKISILKWSFDTELNAVLMKQISICVPDLHGILAWENNKKITVYLYGIGIQIIDLKMVE